MPTLDTNILVHYVRQDALSKRIEARFGLLTAATSPIINIVTEGEIRGLALQFGWGPSRQQLVQNLVGYLTIIPLPFPGVIDAYAQIEDYSRRSGVAMGKNDVWIAATAHITGERLLTTDRDFDHLHGVFLQRDWIDPTAT